MERVKMAEPTEGIVFSAYFVAVKMGADVKIEEQHGDNAEHAPEQIYCIKGKVLRNITS